MTVEERKELLYRINDEGFHYTFKHYSDFREIEDETFHKLRRQYLKSAELLSTYIEDEDKYNILTAD